MTTSTEIVGMDPKGLDNVKALFHRQIDEGLHPGAAMAVYRNDKLVLDLYGGMADVEAGTPVKEDTLFVIFFLDKTPGCLLLAPALGEGPVGDGGLDWRPLAGVCQAGQGPRYSAAYTHSHCWLSRYTPGVDA